MTFRDDGEAMRARLEVVERERDEALRGLGELRVEHAKQQVRADQGAERIAELEAQLGGRPRPRTLVKWAGVVLIVVAVAGLAAAHRADDDARQARSARELRELTRQLRESHEEVTHLSNELDATRREASASAAAAERAEAAQAQAMGSAAQLSVQVSSTQIPADLLEALMRAANEVQAPDRETIVWPARVRSAEGAAPVAAGQTCSVRARVLRQDGRVSDVTVDVACGQTPVYTWGDPSGGGTQVRSCRTGAPDRRGGARVELACEDRGTRTGRPQMSLDTARRALSIWREAEPAFRLELALVGAATVEPEPGAPAP